MGGPGTGVVGVRAVGGARPIQGGGGRWVLGKRSGGESGDRGPIVGAVDIGSNSIKLTVGRPGRDGRPEELLRASQTVRLGKGVDATGRLAEDRLAAALVVLNRFAADARALGASRLVGVATEATRAAANGPAFLDRVRRETGLEIASISGAAEANLVFRGLAATVDLAGCVVAADIGGGSTEVLAIDDGVIRSASSVRLGSGTLTDRHVAGDPPPKEHVAACVEASVTALADLDLPRGAGTRLIIIGGTGRYLARLHPPDRPLNLAAVDEVLAELGRVPAAAVAERLSIAPIRAQVLPAGVAIVRALAARTEPVHVEAARSTVRVGLLLSMFGVAGGSAASA